MSNELHSESTEDRNNDAFNEDGVESTDIETNEADTETEANEAVEADNDEAEVNEPNEADTEAEANEAVEADTDEAEVNEDVEDDTDDAEENEDVEDENNAQSNESESDESEDETTKNNKLTLTIKQRLNDEALSNSLDKAVSEFNNYNTIINLFLFEFVFRNFELDSTNAHHIEFLRTNNIITKKSGGTRKNRHSLRNTRRHI
jgi:hypothetical protein